ncbi:MAG TPA: hypothetical protein QF901_06455, partial [Gammaproteobacteria bacterium]|nr:hypothetical protein [Gammaproteobacteria bacterium]
MLDVFVKSGTRGEAAQNLARTVPVEFEINKVRSVVEMELDAEGASLLGHSIPIDSTLNSGWGSVTLPGDSNPLDNRFYFVFSEPRVREAVIVTDDAKTGEAFRLGLAIPMESGLEHSAVVVPSSRVGENDWESTALLVWQAPLPDGLVAEQVERFVDAGRVAMFFPPEQKGDGQLFDSRWGDWKQLSEEEDRKLSWWRGDADLLAHVGSGDALPLDDLRTYRYCSIEKPSDAPAGTPLATLGTDMPLLMRAATDHGGVYFFATLPSAQFSSLERDAVSFYVMLQRAITEGSRSLATASQRDADAAIVDDLATMEIVAPATNAPTLSERGLHAGVYRDGDYWMAINRGLAEDDQKVAAAATVDLLFDGLSYQRINDAVG